MSFFGREIRRLRMDRGWSQMELAERAGVCMQSVGSWERGLHSPCLAMVYQVAEAFDVEPGKLLGP